LVTEHAIRLVSDIYRGAIIPKGKQNLRIAICMIGMTNLRMCFCWNQNFIAPTPNHES